ncbi:UROL1 protein, partial [Onychorhynchus coronatus]|nr:UROL1 protein [Onychorhynchus coronatus]
TSKMIQFSWKPQGGTGDSPYTVLLQGKSGEMEKKILNGTSTAFENLLSGHQYQISVDVSTCSKNVSTSLTVQTAAEVYSGTTRITNKEFKPEYQNKSSREFQEFETKFIAEITKHLPQEIQELKNGTKMRIVINSIKNGSVIVLFDIVLDAGQNITEPEISDAFTEALNMSTEFEVDPQRTVIEARNSCQPDLNDCSQNAACAAEGATYSCQCKEGFTDNSPQVPGRVCQQDLTSLTALTTVPPETETTGVTGSTSHSIFTTTFPSPSCMPVSIEIQNVTGEEIQLSWTGGTTGSLYNIYLKDRKQEINKTTTKETKAVFKHLLPAHVYIISVGVSSCAENNQTSVTVRTDPVSCFNRIEVCLPENTACSDLKGIVCSDNQTFACRVFLKNQTFNNTLYNSDSEEYTAMAESIRTDVVREMRLELKVERFDIVVLGFRNGSVIADFISQLPKEEPVDVNAMQTHLSQILKRKFGDGTKLIAQRK